MLTLSLWLTNIVQRRLSRDLGLTFTSESLFKIFPNRILSTELCTDSLKTVNTGCLYLRYIRPRWDTADSFPRWDTADSFPEDPTELYLRLSEFEGTVINEVKCN